MLSAAPSTPELSSGTPAAGRPGGSGTAAAILDVAEEAFAEHGFEGVSLRAVATRVGIRAPSLYNHFPSKEALYAAVLERGVRPVLELLTDMAHGGEDAVLERTLAHLEAHPHLARLIGHETLSGGQRLTPMLREWIGPVFREAERLVESTPGVGRWQPEQRPLLVLAMYHMVVGYFGIAPLYADLTGRDLLSAASLAQQADLLRRVQALLFDRSERCS